MLFKIKSLFTTTKRTYWTVFANAGFTVSSALIAVVLNMRERVIVLSSSSSDLQWSDVSLIGPGMKPRYEHSYFCVNCLLLLVEMQRTHLTDSVLYLFMVS